MAPDGHFGLDVTVLAIIMSVVCILVWVATVGFVGWTESDEAPHCLGSACSAILCGDRVEVGALEGVK